MNKMLLLISLCSLFICANAQQHMPAYYEVLKNFFTKYNAGSENDNYTNFAKKKDGWYVQRIDRLKKNKLISEKVFWNLEDGKYRDLSDNYITVTDSLAFEEKIEPYLNYDWYGYEHILYYGYNGWQNDMIKDFGNAANLTDTMLDALGRAYDNIAYGYLWYQMGDYAGQDPLQKKLGRVEFPSAERVEKVVSNIDNGILQFEKLNALNPNYKTIVGNGNLKLFNEYMHGYNQMFMCGDDDKAKKYLDKIHLDERYINQAKNYLNSCGRNAILFSFGDNDTYQLWYVQEKLGYRKDVLVINTSLLDLPVYPVLLRRKRLVNFSTPESFLQDEASDIIYFQEEKDKTKAAKLPTTLHEFIKAIYLKKHLYTGSSPEFNNLPAYGTKKINIVIPSSKEKRATIELKDYLFGNDFLILDIVDNNLFTRPIYFSSSYGSNFDNYLSPSGIVYKLDVQKVSGADPGIKEIKELEKYILEKHVPVLSNYNGPITFVSSDGDNSCLGIYSTIIQYYFSKNDRAAIKKWANLLLDKIPDISINNISTFGNLAPVLIEIGNKSLAKKIIELNAQYTFDAYQNPSSLKGFYSRKRCVDAINQMQSLLQQINENSTIVADIYQKLYVE